MINLVALRAWAAEPNLAGSSPPITQVEMLALVAAYEAMSTHPTEVRRNDAGDVDEIVAAGVVHLEMMDRDHVWIGVYPPGEEQVHIDICAVIPKRRKRPAIRIVNP